MQGIKNGRLLAKSLPALLRRQSWEMQFPINTIIIAHTGVVRIAPTPSFPNMSQSSKRPRRYSSQLNLESSFAIAPTQLGKERSFYNQPRSSSEAHVLDIEPGPTDKPVM